MTKSLPFPLRPILLVLLPLIAIGLARFMTHTDWAEANPGWAAMIFAWIALDGLALALMAKAPDHKLTLHQMAGILTAASVIVIIGAAEPVRQIYLGFPEILTALALTGALFVAWSVARCVRVYRQTGSAEQALGVVLPELQVRFMLAELRTLRLALFSWGAAPDVPKGWAPYTYHTYLTPMLATLLVLQLIELSVMHLLLMLWNPTVAYVLLALSIWGVIWTVALLKSFRLNPVLLGEDCIRARWGMINDVCIPIELIADTGRAFTSEELDTKAVLNLAMFSSPNVSLRLREPIVMRTMFGGSREISGVALRLEDSATFVSQLAERDQRFGDS